jgi:hypothetical protein
MWLRDVPGAVTADELARTVDAVRRWQLPDGMIPWFPGGHADPWNHVEAAMALLLGGERAAADRAFDWLAARQRADGSWHRYYLADRVEEDKSDANCCAYVATGVWHHFLCTGDRAALAARWPMVEAAVDFVLDLQTPRGEILWARHSDGTPWPYALLTGSSSVSHSLRCALAIAAELGRERPDWELSVGRLLEVIRTEPEAFAPKHRWAMDWYYPVLVGAVVGAEGRARLEQRRETFVMAGHGVRCVLDQPWVTAAETCECALAHLGVGERALAEDLFRWAQAHRDGRSGHYFTGLVHPGAATFPDAERTSYTGAAIVLAADALAGASPASGLFVDHDLLPAGLRLPEGGTETHRR